MGPVSNSLAAVDQYGKVHGVQSLRVVDASIMPVCMRSSKPATTVIIGDNIADFIRQGR
jgi:choline dehydrogenase